LQHGKSYRFIKATFLVLILPDITLCLTDICNHKDPPPLERSVITNGTTAPSAEAGAEINVDQFSVKWDTGETANSQNRSNTYKSWAIFQLAMLACAGSLASSSISPATADIVGAEFFTASVSLYNLGFAFGPSCWALSAKIWRPRWSILPATMALGCFTIGTATSRNI
jgi:hypothetical protein